MDKQMLNYIDGEWCRPDGADTLDVVNPATAQPIAEVVLSPAAEVDRAVQVAAGAFEAWRRTPAGQRVQPLFKLKDLLEENLDELARIITNECGKTYKESAGEMRRAIENVEMACGMPSLMQGQFNEDIAPGIDEYLIRQPLGVTAAIVPFNFPGMIPFWFFPYAVATGNCFILKPSEKVPMASQRVFQLVEQAGFPPGVLQLVNGARETSEALIDHPLVRAISFVGTSRVAQAVYSRATALGKRAQCQGGAKNPILIMPDADMDMTVAAMSDSAYGCAGQRCLAVSVAITVGDEARELFLERMVEEAKSRRVGYGLDEGVRTGPVITAQSKDFVESSIAKAEKEGAKALVDGRGKPVSGYEEGYFVSPTILDNVDPGSEIARTEIFGPVLSMVHAKDMDEAMALANAGTYGNMACIFTTSGPAARRFRYEIQAGNVGVNIGVAAPMAFYPFSGWRDSFFGDLHGQGRHAVEFYTQTKVVIERWPA